jgi:DDE superfamily endonuclease
VETIEYRTVAAGHSVAAEEWLAEFDCGFARIAGRFGRVEPRRRARAYLLGLLSDVNTRRCWQLAEHAGDRSPHRIQRLLGEAVWDADKVRDDVRGYVVDELGDPEGVLILDDTGDLKKGSASVGTQRQYTGTAGRIETVRWRCSWPTPARARPEDQKLIPLTVNEIHRLVARLVTTTHSKPTGWRGPAGAACTKPAPRPATTAAAASSLIGQRLHNDPGLEY